MDQGEGRRISRSPRRPQKIEGVRKKISSQKSSVTKTGQREMLRKECEGDVQGTVGQTLAERECTGKRRVREKKNEA